MKQYDVQSFGAIVWITAHGGRVTLIVVLATGGTIASRQSADGGARAADGVDALLQRVPVVNGVTLSGREVLRANSFAMTLEDMRTVLAAVEDALAESDVDGVVVTHGTDTMEETAMLVDLFLGDDRPVVFTGAQRGADQPDTDGPANLRDAITVAASPATRGLGVVIVFDGAVYPARGTVKAHTVASAGFANPDTGALGTVGTATVRIHSRPQRETIAPSSALADGLPRVDIVPVYPGADAVALAALAAAGAKGIVLEATGAGNANPAVCSGVRDLIGAGVVVLVSTRVHAGPVVPLYGGNGGGFDLEAAGAIPAGRFRPGQARILLTALLATDANREQIRRVFDAAAAPRTRT